MILIFMAAATADIDVCASAVHGDLSSAVTACDASAEKVDLFGSGGTTDACLKAFKSGQDAGKYGPKIPAPARNSLIREFDEKLKACKAPAEPSAVPTRDSVKLWD